MSVQSVFRHTKCLPKVGYIFFKTFVSLKQTVRGYARPGGTVGCASTDNPVVMDSILHRVLKIVVLS